MVKRAVLMALFGGLCSVGVWADTFVTGVENTIPGSPTTIEGLGDFNDLMVSLQGSGLTLVSTDGGSWSSFSAGIVNQNQTYPSANANPFWDNQSLDGSHESIGYCLTTNNCGMGGSAGSPVDGVNQYLHGASGIGSADNGFYFSFTGQVATVNLGAIAARAQDEALGWYNINNPSQMGTIIPLGSASAAGSYSFTPAVPNFGLWFYVSGTYYYSQTSLGGSGAPASRFAVFRLANPVPEPGTLALFGLGALALGVIQRLRKRK